jgi:hypothetical protein
MRREKELQQAEERYRMKHDRMREKQQKNSSPVAPAMTATGAAADRQEGMKVHPTESLG